jgi:hypothetical protein
MSELNENFSNMTLKDYCNYIIFNLKEPVELKNINSEKLNLPEKDAYFYVIKSYKPDNIVTV